MKLLFLGDVVGKSGRDVVANHLARVKKELGIDFCIVNGENAANGFGVNEKIINTFVTNGANVVTCGDHTFDQKETKFFIGQYPQMLRPANMPPQLPGKGFSVYSVNNDKKILVIHLMCQLFMRFQVNCPFEVVTNILSKYQLGKDVNYIFVDIHGEATSEKMAIGHYLDGKVSAVVGTHTHVPTADVQIFPKGTAYHTDAGMCGDYDSVIGFRKDISIPNFLNKIRGPNKMEPAESDGTMCGTYVELDDNTGLAKKIDYIRVGGRLKQHMPQSI